MSSDTQARRAVEVDLIVNGCGVVTFANVQVSVEDQLPHLIGDGCSGTPCPCPRYPQARGRIRGARLSARHPGPPDGPVRIQRRVYKPCEIQVCQANAQVDETRFQILDQHGTILTVVPRINSKEVTCNEAYCHSTRRRALESVKHQLKPSRQPSSEARHRHRARHRHWGRVRDLGV